MLMLKKILSLLVLSSPLLVAGSNQGNQSGGLRTRALAPKCKGANDCEDLDDLTLDMCDESRSCVHTLCEDAGDCTGFVNDNGTPTDKEDDFCDLVCPDPSASPSSPPSAMPSPLPSLAPSEAPTASPSKSPSTSPSESPSSAPTACLPQDACSIASYNSQGECIQEVKDCNDNDVSTIDTCSYQFGCQHIRADAYMNFELVFRDVDIFYEDATGLSRGEELAILNWIKTEVTQIRTPFCWKQSYGRGVGYVLSDCPAGKEKIGALCYSPCRDGYSRQGTFDCQQECKPGWRDDGLLCRLAEYGRGGGFPWKFGDGFSNSGMIRRCERRHGRGKCEPWGAIWYPKCKAGYAPFGCCICRPSPAPNCRDEGYNGGIGLSCPVKIELGDPTPLICAPHLEQGGALCYPRCRDGYNGVGPVCWQQCDSDQVNCGAGCASSSEDCGFAILDQVLAPIILAANVLTFGLADAAGDVVDAVQVGNKLVKASTRAGRAMLRLVNLLQTLDNSVGNAVRMVRDGRRLFKGAEIIKVGYGASQNFGHAFAEQFAEMTSDAIASTIDSKLNPVDALHIKKSWAAVQMDEMRTANNWAIADTALAVAGLLDPTGVVDLVGAYAKPTCLDVIPFPMLAGQSNAAPQAICKPNVILSADASCRAAPDPELDLDDGSYDPEGSLIERLLVNPGPYGIGDSSVTLEVVDHEGASGSCDTVITVADTTPPTIECTQRTTVNNDPGQCGAVVSYTTPQGEDNCDSWTLQTGGLPSSSFFGVGVTANGFEVTDTSGYQAACQFNVTVVDAEPPTLSCSDLATNKGNDPGVCSAVHHYVAPVGKDNCETVTNQFEGPQVGFDPFVFPVGSTTNSFQTTDPDGNYDTCRFDVTIEDVEDPVLTCPVDTIRVCNDIDPSVAGLPTATDNCGVDLVSYSDNSEDGMVGDCPEITLRTWTAVDEAANAVDCTQKIVEIPSKPDAVTTGGLCTFDQSFRAMFVPDRFVNEAVPREDANGFAKPPFTFRASNPGGFAYNVFHFGTPGETASFVLDIPYPFVSSSGGSMEAFDWLDLKAGSEGQACFDQDGQTPFFTDSSTRIDLSDYPMGACGDRTSVTVNLVIPASGFVHLTIPLELGLTPHNGNDPVGDLLLPNHCPSLTFSVSGASESSTTLDNVNVYKNNPSLVGFVVSAAGKKPRAGASVSLRNAGNGQQVDSAVTDEDGFYTLTYQPRGRPVDYTVAVEVEGTSDSVTLTLQNKDYRVVNFSV